MLKLNVKDTLSADRLIKALQVRHWLNLLVCIALLFCPLWGALLVLLGLFVFDSVLRRFLLRLIVVE